MCHKMLQWRRPNADNFFTSGFHRTIVIEISGSGQHASVSDRSKSLVDPSTQSSLCLGSNPSTQGIVVG